MKNMPVLLSFCYTMFACQFSHADTLKIYHDADYSNSSESARAMLMGMETALSEVDHQIQGYQIEVLKKDHRGNALRSKRHMKQFLEDDQALFVLGGMHSPPYIRYLDYINENEILLLVAWAAGSPITRYDKGENWVYRLSLDDTKAGQRLAQFALEEKTCRQPHLLLEDTPWGKANFSTLSKYSKRSEDAIWPVTWFGWNTGFSQARTELRAIQAQKADCIIFVGNHLEGEKFVKATASLDQPRPAIISHWGITGGNFQELVPVDIRNKVDLNFIQTCYSFMSPKQSDHAVNVFSEAKTLFPAQLKSAQDIKAPVGFAHAYDIGKLVIAALHTTPLDGSMVEVRRAFRRHLESIQDPVQGLVKTYQTPFTQWSPESPDAHEALGLNDICMARFNDQNQIILH